MKEHILGIISIVIGMIGLVQSFFMLFRTLAAQKEFSRKFQGKANELSKLLDNKDLHVYAKVNIDDARLKELIEKVKQVAEELPGKKREDILEPLEQKSFKGRINYLNRLLRLSGSNLKISVQG
jgi:hypothetical protein